MANKEILVRGGTRLQGTILVPGFKHALVSVLGAATMAGDEVRICNAPDIEDTRVLCEILRWLGGQADEANGVLTLNSGGIRTHEIPDHLSRKIHGSLYLLPGLLARLGNVALTETGGCQIGPALAGGQRPIGHVLNVLERFGASFEVSGQKILGICKGFRPAVIDIGVYSSEANGEVSGPLVSGATKTALLAAATARGSSVIINPYRKPDVTELLIYLDSSGIEIEDNVTSIVVGGKPTLRRADHELPSDLIEVITLIAAIVHLKAKISLTLRAPQRTLIGLASEVSLLQTMGVTLILDGDQLTASRTHELTPQDIVVKSSTIYSDSQPFFALMLTEALGVSTIQDRVWEERFGYAEQLNKLGTSMELLSEKLNISNAKPRISGQKVLATELRGAAVLVLAALGIDGWTRIAGIEHLERGYESFITRLRHLGADIDVVE